MRSLVFVIVSVAAARACVPVERDRIVAGDLAKAVPELAGIPSEVVFGFAPQPGLRTTPLAVKSRSAR
jgi:hypothetical protein